jgi:hypothetical protein
VDTREQIGPSSNDPELPLSQLAEWFRVSKVALQEQERLGRVRFPRILVRGMLTAVAPPSQISHLPIYRVGDAARIAGVSTRTIHRWGNSRLLVLSRSGNDRQWRTSPRQLALCLQHRREAQRKRKPPKLSSLLDSLLDEKSGAGGSA